MPISRIAALTTVVLAAGALADAPLPFQFVKAGVSCRLDKPGHLVFRTPGQFSNFWADAFGPAPQPRGIDWAKSELVAINLGRRGSLGYRATVRSVERVGANTVVTWAELIPARAEKARAMATSPYVIVSFPTQPGKVLFRHKIEDAAHAFDPGNAVAFQPYLRGAHCMARAASSRVITDQDQLDALWAEAFGRTSKPLPCDFSKWRLAAVFLGQCPTPGYEPIIDGVVRTGPASIELRFSETAPEPGKVLPQVVTNPFVIVKLPVSQDELTIVRS